MTNPSWLPENAQTVVADAVRAIERGAGEKLEAILLVGAAIDPARHRGKHAPELLVVLTDLPVATLTNIAHQLADTVGEAVRLRLFTKGELMRSADVFTLELAEYRDRNKPLYGADPYVSLHFTPGELRRSIEQWLRRLSRDVRQAVLRAGRSA